MKKIAVMQEELYGLLFDLTDSFQAAMEDPGLEDGYYKAERKMRRYIESLADPGPEKAVRTDAAGRPSSSLFKVCKGSAPDSKEA